MVKSTSVTATVLNKDCAEFSINGLRFLFVFNHLVAFEVPVKGNRPPKMYKRDVTNSVVKKALIENGFKGAYTMTDEQFDKQVGLVGAHLVEATVQPQTITPEMIGSVVKQSNFPE